MRNTTWCVAAVLLAYVSLYACARLSHVLVMYDGYRGKAGVGAADLGPAPPQAVLIVGTSACVFRPLMAIETALR